MLTSIHIAINKLKCGCLFSSQENLTEKWMLDFFFSFSIVYVVEISYAVCFDCTQVVFIL